MTSMTTTTYEVQGRLLEVCTCNVLCPCWVGEDPDGDGTCDSILGWYVDSGTVQGVDVSDRCLCVSVHIPGNVLAGNWKAAVLVDDRCSEEQQQALLSVFTGQLGGAVADLAALIGEVVAVEHVPITFDVVDGKGEIRIGDLAEARLTPSREPGRDADVAARLGVLHDPRLARVRREGRDVPPRREPARAARRGRARPERRAGFHSGSPPDMAIDRSPHAPAATPARALAVAVGCWLLLAGLAVLSPGLAHHHGVARGAAPRRRVPERCSTFAGAWLVMVAAMMLPSDRADGADVRRRDRRSSDAPGYGRCSCRPTSPSGSPSPSSR